MIWVSKSIAVLTLLVIMLAGVRCSSRAGLTVSLQHDPSEKRVNVYAGDQLFTSYLYSDEIDVLKKPVLYPVYTAGGHAVTRGYPLDPIPGERVDHPHHIGFWLNYGDVNGLDFWNNSNAISAEREPYMGTIRHRDIEKIDKNSLWVSADWLSPDGEVLLHENTQFQFSASESTRVIDRVTTLTALDSPVVFKDNKEGFVGIRVTRALEHPSDKAVKVTDASGVATTVPVMDNSNVTGNYLNADGVEGVEVWGKRSPWVDLRGVLNTEPVHIVLMDHPDNVGYPTYWHARGYGLFAANPLGQKVFSDGDQELNFTLQPGEKVTFRYRLAVISGDVDKQEIESRYQAFAGK